MTRYMLSSVFAFFLFFSAISQTTHTININGLSFTPNEVTIAMGDTVFFNGSSNHPVLEVAENTWNNNGSTALPGGFAFPSGTGKISFDSESTHYYICENHIGNGMKGKIIVSTTTGINFLNSNNISIYPNPLTGTIIYINVSNNTSEINLSLYDLTGRVKISKKVPPTNDQIQLDASYLSPGVYIIQLQSAGYTYTSKFIKN